MPKYVFNPETLMYEARSEPKYVKHIRVALLSVLALGLVVMYFWLYLSVFHFELPRTAALKRRHAEWEAKMNLMDRQLDIYEQTLTGIEQRDDDVYRSIYGLNPIPEQVRNSGLEGVNRYAELDRLGANSHLRRAVRRLDDLTKRAYVRSKSLDEVGDLSRKAGDMISCVPNVPPILPAPGTYRLSSSFGYRIDPVYGGGERHGGQDFATRTGTPVYVTGDGVVEKTGMHLWGYGNEIVIDHGYGYQTRYAHLNTIEVAPGMKLHRGDRIGTVGNTGKSTGAHLHYEVIYKGNRVNPMNFLDMNMPEDEYRAMIERRSEDARASATMSTMELLRRGRKVK